MFLEDRLQKQWLDENLVGLDKSTKPTIGTSVRAQTIFKTLGPISSTFRSIFYYTYTPMAGFRIKVTSIFFAETWHTT